MQVEGAWTHNVERAGVTTIYSRLGDWISWLSAGVVLAILALGVARSRGGRRKDPQG